MQMLLFLVVRSVGLCVHAGVNDAPVVAIEQPAEKSDAQPAAAWVMPERNRLVLKAIPAGQEGCAGALPEGAEAKVEAVLSTTPDGAHPIAQLSKTFAAGEAPAPVELETPFDPPEKTGSKLWTTAQPIARLDAQTKAAALDLARRYHQALQSRDVEKAYALTEWRTKDLATVRGENPKAELQQTRGSLTKLLRGKEKLTLEPFDPKTVEARLVAGGKVVALTGQGRPLIRGKAGADADVAFDLYVAQFNGRWVIVR